MNINSPSLDANINLAAKCSKHTRLSVEPIRTCGGCGGDATVMLDGRYPRCPRCANKVVSVWSEMRNHP